MKKHALAALLLWTSIMAHGILLSNEEETKIRATYPNLQKRPRIARKLREEDIQSFARQTCQVAGESGTCMFVWECLKTEGKHLGMCMDGFMFGSCCVHDDDDNKVIQSDEDTVKPDFEAEFEAELQQQQQKPINAVAETAASVLPLITIDRPTRPPKPSRPSRPTKKPSQQHVKWPNFHIVDQQPTGSGSANDEKKDTTQHHFVSIKAPQDPRPSLTTRRPPLVTDRRPTVSWSWQEKVSTTDKTSTSLSNFYFPNQDEIISDFDDFESSTTVNRPTRPTRPPKPSTMDLVTYFPPFKNNNKPIPTFPPTSSTTRRTTTTTRPTTIRTTTSPRTTRRTTTTTSQRPPTTTLRPLQNVNPIVTIKKPQQQQPRAGGCGLPQRGPSCPKGRIVNGTQSCYGQFPWQVSVRRTSFFGFSSTHRCGGALINELWVATAGHCVDDLLLPKIRVRIGEWDFSSTSEMDSHVERKVKEKIVHPKYNFFTYEYDLALLKLDKRVDFQDNIIPICLPGNDDLLIGEMGIVAGWGRLSEGGQLPSILQYVSVPIVSNDKCKSMFLRAGRQEVIPGIFMCAGYDLGGRDSCQGDSGGPLVVKGSDGRWFLGGIISWGIGCAEPNLPGVCTRISKFTDWILSNVT